MNNKWLTEDRCSCGGLLINDDENRHSMDCPWYFAWMTHPSRAVRKRMSTRHEFFIKLLKELGVYDKDSDYGGLIGKWVEELSDTFQKQGHSGMSAVITISLLNKLFEEYSNPQRPQTDQPLYEFPL